MTNKVEYVDLTVNCPCCDTENTVELENNLGLTTERCYNCKHLFDVIFSCSINTITNHVEDEQRDIAETEESLMSEDRAAFLERWCWHFVLIWYFIKITGGTVNNLVYKPFERIFKSCSTSKGFFIWRFYVWFNRR